jgi:GT2 family glycosyltransferase
MLRTLAYWQAGRQHLDAGRPQAALDEFRHIFASLRGKVPATVIHTQLLNDMARCYKELGDAASAARCERETLNLVSVGHTPIPSEPRGNRSKKESKLNSPEISVVLPTYNRKDKLQLCLAALAFQSLPAHRWEVIVVDDGSSDATESFCRNIPWPFASFRYIRQENAGAGAARHRGAEEASGEFLLLCNDDTIASPTLLAEHLSVLRQYPSPKLAVLGDFQPAEDCNQRALSMWVNWSPFFFPQRNMKPGELCGKGHFVTCNMSIRRDDVLKAGNFDPAYRVGEDTELGSRLERMGLRVHYHPAASAWHDHPEFTTANLIRRAQVYGRITWALYQKHPWLLRDGKGFFGQLNSADFARIQAHVEEKREAVANGVAALGALDTLDFRPLLPSDTPEGRKGREVLGRLGQVVPLVYWNYFYESFLNAWKDSRKELGPFESSEIQVRMAQ